MEFFRHKYLEFKEGSPYHLLNGSFNDDWESSSESYWNLLFVFDFIEMSITIIAFFKFMKMWLKIKYFDNMSWQSKWNRWF